MSTPGAPSPAPSHRARILLVDDDPLITDLVVDMLGMDGHDVETASDGMEALERLKSQRFDLIVTDLHMPKLDGAAFYRELRDRQAHPLKKIIFLSGTTGGSPEHKAVMESGAPMLLKPFNVTDLIDLVRSMLQSG
jgi:DNA-binding response OmpR family regulator